MRRHAKIIYLSLIAASPLVDATGVFAEKSIPAKMCTRGFERPAYLLETPEGYDLHIGKTVEKLANAGSMGTGLNGRVVTSGKSDRAEAIFVTEITMFSSGIEADDDIQRLLIFRDRVFWPCVK